MGVNLESETTWLNEERGAPYAGTKGNYSLVFHDGGPPSSVNEHIQKSGRAGRNPNELADDITFLEPYMTMRQVAMYCGDPAAIYEYRKELLCTLDFTKCRQVMMGLWPANLSESKSRCMERCDNCRRGLAPPATAIEVRITVWR